MNSDFTAYKRMLLEDSRLLDTLHKRWQQGLPGQPWLLELAGQPSQLEQALPKLRAFAAQFRLEPADIQYLGGLQASKGRSRYPESFINYLQRQSFSFEWSLRTAPLEAPALLVKGPRIALELLSPALRALLQSDAIN